MHTRTLCRHVATAARLVAGGIGAHAGDLSGFDWCIAELGAAGCAGLADGLLLDKARTALAARCVDSAAAILQARLRPCPLVGRTPPQDVLRWVLESCRAYCNAWPTAMHCFALWLRCHVAHAP